MTKMVAVGHGVVVVAGDAGEDVIEMIAIHTASPNAGRLRSQNLQVRRVAANRIETATNRAESHDGAVGVGLLAIAMIAQHDLNGLVLMIRFPLNRKTEKFEQNEILQTTVRLQVAAADVEGGAVAIETASPLLRSMSSMFRSTQKCLIRMKSN